MLGVVNNVDGGLVGSNETNDNLVGGAEDNVFFVGRGIDIVAGGDGTDTLNVDGEAIEWTFETLFDGRVRMTHPTWGTNTLESIEFIFFARSGTTLSVQDAIDATAGLPAQRLDSDNVVNGTNVDDILIVTDGVQGLYGGLGNDSFIGSDAAFSQVNYDGQSSEFIFTQNDDGSITISHPIWGTDTITNIDALVFTGREPGVDGAELGGFEFLSTSDIIFDEDIAGDSSTTATLEIGQTVTSAIVGDGDADAFAITIAAGQTVNFSQITGINFDREVVLTDSNGNSVAQGSAAFRTFRISNEDFVFQAEETDTYFLTISALDIPGTTTQGFGQGVYSLTATEIEDDFGNFAFNATQLDSGENIINGNLEYLNDVDRFEISLAEGDVLNLAVLALETPTEFAPETVAYDVTLIGPNGEIISRAFNTNSTIDFTALESGTYTITIEATFDSNVDFRNPFSRTGEYTLTTNVTPAAPVTIEPSDTNFISGTEAADRINGTSINDEISANDGDDRVLGRDGDDGITGGSGNDTLIGGNGDDRLFGGNDEDRLLGQDGNDQLFGGIGDDTLLAGDGDDLLEGGNGDDALHGQNGNDSLIGGEGNDRLFGGDGDDGIFGGEGIDVLSGGDGMDILTGGAGNDRANGGSGDDTIYGDDGNDRLLGNAGNDDLIGGNGNDRLFGQSGNDTLDGQNGNDVLLGGNGDDDIFGGDGNDNLRGQDGNDLLAGQNGDDDLQGGDGDDNLIGGNGDDALSGGNGMDIIFGGAGNDFLLGDAGADTFVFNTDEGHDTIADFESDVDLIDLTDFGFESFEDLNITTNSEGHVAIFLSEDQSIALTNLDSVDDLDASDFLL